MPFFLKKSVGIDIADHTIEVVELRKIGTKVKVSSKNRVFLEPGIVVQGRIRNEEKLAKAIKEVFLKAKPYPIKSKRLIFGLPENQVYLHIFELAPHSKEERYGLLFKEAQENIPLKKDDFLFSYKILNEDKEKVEVLLVATSKKLALEWEEFFEKLKLKVEIFDIESLAIFRGLFVKPKKEPVCIVDLGAATTNITVFDKKGLRYSRSINIAGSLFTNEIAKALKIEPEEAEKKKIKIGLSERDNPVFSILVKSLESIVKEIRTLISYFEKKTGRKIKEVILVGGSSKLKGIVDYFDINLELPIRIGKSILLGDKVYLEYIEAVGLALRGIDKKWSQRDPALKIGEEKEISREEGISLVSCFSSFLLKIKKEKLSERGDRPSLITDIDQREKLRSKKTLLAIIVIIGIVIVSLSFWYRSYEKAKLEKEIKSQAVQYKKTQSFDLEIPIAVTLTDYSQDRVRGRIIEDTIKAAGSYNEAVAHSRTAVLKELEGGEKLWFVPIDKLKEEQEVIFPLTIKWLVYFQEDVSKLFLKEIDKLNEDRIEYSLNNIEKKDIKRTENPNIFYLEGRVTISLNELIELKETEEEETEVPPEPEVSKKVIIKETETGWLRVRKGPDTVYPEITKVYPGESFPLLEELEGWYKIELKDKREGWISGEYARME